MTVLACSQNVSDVLIRHKNELFCVSHWIIEETASVLILKFLQKHLSAPRIGKQNLMNPLLCQMSTAVNVHFVVENPKVGESRHMHSTSGHFKFSSFWSATCI